MTEKVNVTKSRFLENINRIDKPLVRLSTKIVLELDIRNL